MVTLTRNQVSSLESAGLSKDQINIVVHNLDKLLSANKITKESIEIVVHNLVKDEKFQRSFFANPSNAILEIIATSHE